MKREAFNKKTKNVDFFHTRGGVWSVQNPHFFKCAEKGCFLALLPVFDPFFPTLGWEGSRRCKKSTLFILFLEASLTSIIQRVHVLLLVRSCFVTIFLGRGWQQSQAEVELLAAEANSSLVFTELSLASTAILSDALLLILHFCEKKTQSCCF